MRVKTLLLLMVVIAMPLTFYLFYVKDSTFDTIKSNYLAQNYQIDQMADNIRHECKKWNTTECYVMYANQQAMNIPYTSDNFIQDLMDWDNDINYTLKNGNDCDGIAVISASLLHELELREIYVITEKSRNGTGHLSIGVRGGDGNILTLNSQQDFVIQKIRKLE